MYRGGGGGVALHTNKQYQVSAVSKGLYTSNTQR